jgi:hypothetical protein
MMEIHRRTKGVGRSKPGDISGCFDIAMGHNRYAGPRTAVCKVMVKQGWECLTIAIKYRVRSRLYERAPNPSEEARLLPLFFHEWELPIRVFVMPIDIDAPARYLLSERSNQLMDHLPQF